MQNDSIEKFGELSFIQVSMLFFCLNLEINELIRKRVFMELCVIFNKLCIPYALV